MSKEIKEKVEDQEVERTDEIPEEETDVLKDADSEEEIPEIKLPQNIVLVGDRDDTGKKIYISQTAYKAIHKFTKDKTKNESGGVLVGEVIEEFGKQNIVIRAFIEAKHCEATPTTLTFTHESWDHIHNVMDKKYSEFKIVGWIHTHPDFGIFLSEYDRFIQDNFFNEENQIAYVIDPIKKEEGFYCWLNGNIEKCRGFFVFDQNDKEIKIEQEKHVPAANESEEKKESKTFKAVVSIIIAVLVVICAVLCVKVNSLEKRIDKYDQIFQFIQVVPEEEAGQAQPDSDNGNTDNNSKVDNE